MKCSFFSQALLLGLLSAGSALAAPLASPLVISGGHYTINSFGETQGRNFASFQDLATSLNGANLTDNVTIDVVIHSAPDPYSIGGGSNNHTTNRGTYAESAFILTGWKSNGFHVTLDGHGETLAVKTSHATSADAAAVQIKSVSNFTLQNLHITTGPTRGWGVWINGLGYYGGPKGESENVTVTNCVIDLPVEGCLECESSVQPAIRIAQGAGIVVSQSYNGLATTNTSARNCTFSYNFITGGYWGIAVAGTEGSDGILIEGNHLVNIGGVGIKALTTPALTIRGNTMTSNLAAVNHPFIGIAYEGNSSERTSTGLLIDGNTLTRFRSPEASGITIADAEGALLSNNFIAGFTPIGTLPASTCLAKQMLGIRINHCNNMSIVNNTVIMDPTFQGICVGGPGGEQVRALYIRNNGHGNCETVSGYQILNNIFAFTGDGFRSGYRADYGVITTSEISGYDVYDNNYFFADSLAVTDINTAHTNRYFSSLYCRSTGGAQLDYYGSLSHYTGVPGAPAYGTNGSSVWQSAPSYSSANASPVTLAQFLQNFKVTANSPYTDYHLKAGVSAPDLIKDHPGIDATTLTFPTGTSVILDVDGNDRQEVVLNGGYYTMGADQLIADQQHRPAKARPAVSNAGAPRTALQLSLAPNPLEQRTLTLNVQTGVAGGATVTVADALGRVLKIQEVTLTSGAQQLPLDLKQLPKGAYFVRVTQGSESVMQQLLKQ